MGLYDTFQLEANCWKCGKPIDDWQTKQLERCMWVYRKGDHVHGVNIIEGTISVYSCCSAPGPFLVNLKTGKTEQPWVSEEKQAEYCGAWNRAIVQIRNGVVDSIKVIDQE